MSEKQCSRCAMVLPAERFSLRSAISGSLQSWCKECTSRYNEENAAKHKRNKRVYYIKNRTYFIEKAKASRVGTLSQRLVNNERWRISNPERHGQIMRRACRNYARSHREVLNAKRLRRNARMLALKHEWTTVIAAEVLFEWENKCAVCRASFRGNLHWDHWIPLASKECPGTSRSNMLPLCRSCNTSKGDRDGTLWVTHKRAAEAVAILNRINTYFQGVQV